MIVDIIEIRDKNNVLFGIDVFDEDKIEIPAKKS